METWLSRTAMLVGAAGIKKLARARVMVFGAGGVGGYAIEALARAGIGTLGVCDGDTVSVTNLNRQILATVDSVGTKKTDAAKARILSINPNANVRLYPDFYRAENAGDFDLAAYDFVVDAIDSVRDKTALIVNVLSQNISIISSMGAGNRLDPSSFRVADIYETSGCPLARVMRNALKKAGVKKLPVVYSPAAPIVPVEKTPSDPAQKTPPGSISFVPAAAGLIAAGYVVNSILAKI
jgi:tRNA A37 threonylcarbamoyladenosine dehydratase